MERWRTCNLLHPQIWPDTVNQIRMNRLLPIILFVIICTFYLSFSWSSVLGDFGGDNAYYLFMAQQFSPYSASSSAVSGYFATNSIFPPFFPLLLGLTGGGDSLLAAHLVTTSFLLVAFVMFFWWLSDEGLGLTVAIATILVVVSLPGIYLQTLSVHSENLYLLCSLAALACASAAQRKTVYLWMILAVMAIAAAYLTRGAGLALVAAWIGWLWLNRMPKRFTFSLAAILPVILWSCFGSTHSTKYWQQLLQGYSHPETFTNQVWTQIHYLFAGWQRNFGIDGTAPIASILLLVTGLVASLWRTWLRHMDGFYVWCYLGLIILWPFPAEAQRMVLLIFPILLWQTVWMLSRWRWEIRGIKPIDAAVLAILMLSLLPELALNMQRFFIPLPSGIPESYRHTEDWYCPNLSDAIFRTQFSAALESNLAHLDKFVPEGECIFTIKPSIVGYLSGRISKSPPNDSMDDASFERALKQQECRFFYLFAFASPSYPVAMYPNDRLRERLEIQDRASFHSREGHLQIVGLLSRLK